MQAGPAVAVQIVEPDPPELFCQGSGWLGRPESGKAVALFLYPVHIRSGVENAVLAEPGKMRLLVVPRQSDELETVLVLPRYVDAPVKKGQKLGTAAFYEGDTLLYEMEVVAADDVRKQNYWDALQKITVKMLKL